MWSRTCRTASLPTATAFVRCWSTLSGTRSSSPTTAKSPYGHPSKSSDLREPCLHFEVADSGVRISPETVTMIFEPFTQADGSITRNYGGTGLGLTISAQLVALMGGRIWVESEVGVGSCFHFTIKTGLVKLAEEAPAARSPTASASDGPRLNVLVAEDNIVNQLVARGLLGRLRHRVTIAADGREAVDAVATGAFDLVFMDVQMPGMDGFEATEAIRRAESISGGHVPIVAMTARAMEGDRARCLAAGMDGYVAKPLSGDELADVVATFTPAVLRTTAAAVALAGARDSLERDRPPEPTTIVRPTVGAMPYDAPSVHGADGVRHAVSQDTARSGHGQSDNSSAAASSDVSNRHHGQG